MLAQFDIFAHFFCSQLYVTHHSLPPALVLNKSLCSIKIVYKNNVLRETLQATLLLYSDETTKLAEQDSRES